jgi:hypothetical protein
MRRFGSPMFPPRVSWRGRSLPKSDPVPPHDKIHDSVFHSERLGNRRGVLQVWGGPNLNVKVCQAGLPFSIGLCCGEASEPWDCVGEVSSTLTADLAKENEGTNSTAFTFNVENLAVTSAL